MTLHTILPEIATGYELNPGRGLLSVIVPRAAVNLIPNPHMERGTAGWRSTFYGQLDPVRPYRGAYSLCFMAPSGAPVIVSAQTGDSHLLQTIPTVAGRTYVLSFAYRTQIDQPTVSLQVRLNGTVSGNTIGGTLGYRVDGRPAPNLPQAGDWRTVVYVWTEIASQNRALFVETTANATGKFWLDDVKMELGLTPSLSINGDISGAGVEAGDYGWYGTPGNSFSFRSAGAVSGGDVVNLADFGFHMIAAPGLGLGGYNNIIQPFATGGGHYSETIVDGRSFSVVGRFDATSLQRLQQQRDALIAVLRHDRSGESRPVFLRYQIARCDELLSEAVDIECVYESGLEGALDSLYAEDVAITFRVFGPKLIAERQRSQVLYNVEAGQSGVVIVLHDRAADAYSYVSLANVTGVRALRPMADGTFMLGGTFANAGGVATANAVCRYNPFTGAVTGYGAATTSGVGVDGFQVSRRGSVFAWGQFTQIGGIAVSNFAEQKETDGGWWGYPFTLDARCRGVVEVGSLLYAYGDFTERMRLFNYATLVYTNIVLAQTSTSVLSAAYDYRTNRIYYTAVNGTTNAHIGYVDVATNTSTLILSVAGSAVTFPGVFIMSDGTVVFARSSTSAGTRSGLYKLTATNTLQALSEFASGYTGGIERVWQDGQGNLHVATVWTTQLGGIYSPAQYWWWDGKQTHASPLHLGRAAYSTLGFTDRNASYQMWVFGSSVFAGIPAANTIEQVGNTVPVRFEFQGPGLLNAIENITTGEVMEFNAVVLMGETITVDTQTGRVSSSLSDSKVVPVLTQSSISRWRLAPGSNRIRVRFWPRLNNAADAGDYTAVLTGTANMPGTAFLLNASRGNTENGKIRWQVDTADQGILSILYNGSNVLTVGTLPATQTIVPGTDIQVPLNGSLDLVPLPGPATGQIFYPLAHVIFDDLLAAVDQIAVR